MTNREAIEALRDLLDTTREYPHLDGMTMFGDAIKVAISALEKRVPMKPLPQEMDIDGRAITPCGFCGEELPHNSLYDFCPYCGQAIDRRKDG